VKDEVLPRRWVAGSRSDRTGARRCRRVALRTNGHSVDVILQGQSFRLSRLYHRAFPNIRDIAVTFPPRLPGKCRRVAAPSILDRRTDVTAVACRYCRQERLRWM
jgi:hypothetical protein